MPELTLERLRSVLDYEPNEGVFRWKRAMSSRAPKGGVAGHIRDDGWRQIAIDGVVYRAGRLAFFHYHGRWPVPTVEHKNRIRSDDRIDNLIEATHIEQHQNTSRIGRSTGEPNIYARGRRFRVKMTDASGVRQDRGSFLTLQEAIKARDAALTQGGPQ